MAQIDHRTRVIGDVSEVTEEDATIEPQFERDFSIEHDNF